MSETSPTEQVDGGAGSASADLPDQTSNNQSADGQQQDSVSSDDSQQADQSQDDQQSQSSTTEDQGSSSDDDGLAKFAKSQGFDPDNLTDGERKALKLAHDNQKAFRQTSQQQSDQLKDTAIDVQNADDSELEGLDEDKAREVLRDREIAQLKADQKVNNFYLRNPEAREYDKEMAEILVEEAKNNGKEAARYLGANFDRLLVLAKARRGNPTEEAKAAGAREERERLRQRQEGSAESGHAQQTNTSTKRITRADIASMKDEEYLEFKKSGGLQEAIERGDLYQGCGFTNLKETFNLWLQ